MLAFDPPNPSISHHLEPKEGTLETGGSYALLFFFVQDTDLDKT
jgi:hypothetical protein